MTYARAYTGRRFMHYQNLRSFPFPSYGSIYNQWQIILSKENLVKLAGARKHSYVLFHKFSTLLPKINFFRED